MVRWKRLIEAAERVAGRKVALYLTSEPTGYRGALVRGQQGEVIIYMDLLTHKEEKDVVETLAHELAHLILETSDHSPEWSKKFVELRKTLEGEQNEGKGKGETRSRGPS